MSDLRTYPDAGAEQPDRRSTASSTSERTAPPLSGGVFDRPTEQIDNRRPRAAVADPPEKRRGRTALIVTGSVVSGAAAATAAFFAFGGNGDAQTAQPERPGGVAIAPLSPDTCTEAFSMSNRSEQEQMALYAALDTHGQPTGELGEQRSGVTTKWVAASFAPQPGMDKYALVIHELPKYSGLGEVVFTPLDPASLRVGADGRVTVYVPVPKDGQRLLVVDYSENRPGAAIPTAAVPYTVGGPAPSGVTPGEGGVCDVSAAEVGFGGGGGGAVGTGEGGDSNLGGSNGGAPSEGEVNDGEVTSKNTP